MRQTNATFKEEKSKKENQPIRLYTVFDYDGQGNDLRFAEYDTNVTFNTLEYQKFPITHNEISENTQGTIDAVEVTVSNISRLIQFYLKQKQYDFRGKKVSIKLVWANQLDDPDAYIEDTYYIDSYIADQNNVTFTLTSKFDVLDMQLPGRKYSRNYCHWKFRSAECGYNNGATECNKTLQRCRELGNQKRFGGFPSIGSSRIFVG